MNWGLLRPRNDFFLESVHKGKRISSKEFDRIYPLAGSGSGLLWIKRDVIGLAGRFAALRGVRWYVECGRHFDMVK